MIQRERRGIDDAAGQDIEPTIPMGASPWPSGTARSNGQFHEGQQLFLSLNGIEWVPLGGSSFSRLNEDKTIAIFTFLHEF